VSRFLEYIASEASRGVRLVGTVETGGFKRVPTVSFVVDGVKSQQVVEQMDKHNIGIRFGGFYSNRLLAALGLESVVRVSFVHYNTLEEVEKLIVALQQVLGSLAKK